MLHEFLSAHRDELIDRCVDKAAKRAAPTTVTAVPAHGVPFFLDQLIKTLQIEQTSDPMQSRTVSGPSGGRGRAGGAASAVPSEIGTTATLHGRELLLQGFTIDQVVHDYGDLCQSITDLAFERGEHIEVDEFRTLNRCLDNGIADAVTEFAAERDSVMADRGSQELNHRLGVLSDELRNLIHTALLAVTTIKASNVRLTGATGAVLDRSLMGLRNIVDRSIAQERVRGELPHLHEPMSLFDFVAKVKASALPQAAASQCLLTVAAVEEGLEVDVDKEMLAMAVGNLLENAFKFTDPESEVSLNVRAAAGRVLIDIADRCGGVAPTAASTFLPFTHSRENDTDISLGLAICRRSVEANNGVLRVREVPGSGCVFTIDLPQYTQSRLPSVL